MITLADFKKFETLEQQLKEFLCEKCNEFREAKYFNDTLATPKNLDHWEFNKFEIVIWFISDYGIVELYSQGLPLDILFDPNFKKLIKERIDKEREQERLRSLKKIRKHDEELKLKAEQKRFEEIELMKELINKYPDELKEVN